MGTQCIIHRLKERSNIENHPSRGANLLPYKLGFVVFAQLWGHNILFISCKCQSLCHRTTNIKNRTYNLQTKVFHFNHHTTMQHHVMKICFELNHHASMPIFNTLVICSPSNTNACILALLLSSCLRS